MFLEQYGLVCGGLLLAIVSATALLLGWRANRSVNEFREERHQRFGGPDPL